MILAVFSLILGFAARVDAQQTFSQSQYVSKLEQVQHDLKDAINGDSSAGNRTLADIRSIERCDVPTKDSNGNLSIVNVDNRPIESSIESDLNTRDYDKLRVQSKLIGSILSAMSQGNDNAMSNPQVPIRQVLSTNEFGSSPVPPESIWDTFVDWFVKQLRKIHWPFHTGPTLPSVSPVIPEVILIVVLVAAVALLGYIIFQIWSTRQAKQVRLSQVQSMLAINAEEQELVETHNYVRLRQLADESALTGF
jgi:hypothetical protein